MAALLLLFPCAATVVAQDRSAKEPEEALDWEVGEPAEVGLDLSRLVEIVLRIDSFQRPDFRALLIARHGKLVLEEYFNGQGPDTLTDIRSAGKSVTSTLVGIAIDKKLIAGVDVEILPFFKRYEPHERMDGRKRKIALRDLLTMRSGLDANDFDNSTPGQELQMQGSPDWIAFALDLPMAHDPGTHWFYSAASTMLLAGMVESAIEGDVFEFAQEHLFEPMGISALNWERTPQGRIVGQGFLSLTGRDALKFGQLYLSGGEWNGRRIVSKSWVREATQAHVDVEMTGLPIMDGYGYQWWRGSCEVGERRIDTFFASGNGGNLIHAVPEMDLVVVILSTAYGTNYGPSRSFGVFEDVLRAVEVE